MLRSYLSEGLQCRWEEIEQALRKASRNVRTVLRRHILNTASPTAARPVCHIEGEDTLMRAFGTLTVDSALFTLARVYDAAHVTLCQTIAAASKGKKHNEFLKHHRCVDVQQLARQIEQDNVVVEDEIILVQEPGKNETVRAEWRHLDRMSFDALPVLDSLARMLPGETSASQEYAGVGGGGGSDIISASLLGHLLRRHGKDMNLLISTRTWSTGSQGGKDSKIGVKREVYNHAGPAEAHGQPVPGTFRFNRDTYAEGRSLEAIPIFHRQQIFMVLDQGESMADIPEGDRADLRDQFDAVLDQAQPPTDTVFIVDTGGDVFGADKGSTTTPDQDLRVQQAMSSSSSKRNLVTVVVSPGVDAPRDAPRKALEAGGMVYKLSMEERAMFLALLANQYKMDGSDPARFGKTTLALQARLRGVVGWTSLDLPEHVVDTWENPWSSFVYVRECMSDIILMPTRKLLPLIQPKVHPSQS